MRQYNPSKGTLEELECLQAEYDQLYDYITQGAIIIRSRAPWYELREKKIFFLNLEKTNKKKSSVRKLFTRDSKLTNNLYDGSSRPLDSANPMFLDVSRRFPALKDDLRKICEGPILASVREAISGQY